MHAHCYLHRPNLVPFGHRLPYAPHYFLKLKSAEALIQVGLPQLCLLTSASLALLPDPSSLQCARAELLYG